MIKNRQRVDEAGFTCVIGGDEGDGSIQRQLGSLIPGTALQYQTLKPVPDWRFLPPHPNPPLLIHLLATRGSSNESSWPDALNDSKCSQIAIDRRQ